MGMYESRTWRPFKITKEQYNYMLAVKHVKERMMERDGKYWFIGNEEMYKDFLNCCKYLD